VELETSLRPAEEEPAERLPEAVELYAEHVNPQFVRVLRTIGFDRAWVRGEGAHIVDAQGNTFLDLVGGFGMFNVGRSNPRVRAALEQALADDLPISVQLGVSTYAGQLAGELLRLLPSSLGRVVFTSSGTEAVEAALKYARAATGRPRVLSAEHGFHGLTYGSLSANGCAEFTEGFGELLPGFERVAFGDPESLERELRREDVAMFLVEPVQGKGVHLPPEGYLQEAQALCRRYGTLFCVDEVQTGFGRTGRMFALDHFGLEPDLVTVAKSLSGGYIPVGACAVSRAVFDAVCNSMENAVRHGSTFAPNELAMVAGLATLDELDRARLPERAARLGALLLELTEPLVERFDVVHDVRGLGLLWGIEFGEPSRGRATWRALERRQPGIFSQFVVGPLFHRHRILSQVAGHRMNVVKALPPLVISEREIERFAAALEDVVRRASRLSAAALGFALRTGVRSVL
jgi:ornithine--oxo-acid transaminase